MAADGAAPSERESRLRDLVLEIEKARDAGREIDRRELIARHPDLAAELTALIPERNPLAPLAELLRSPAAGGCPAAPAGYEIVEELGRGGQSVVYLAHQLSLNRRPVALKMLLAGPYTGPDELARFQRDAQILAGLKHENIVQVYDLGEHQGQPFFCLEYVEGGNLAQSLGGLPQPPREAAKVVASLARAVQVAHEADVVHRDLKPANVLLTKDGTPKITDFGLAKLLDGQATASLPAAGPGPGTILYMAAEQAAGQADKVGPLTDVHALGVILYEMLTGRPPFQGPTLADTLKQIENQRPVSPGRLQPTVPAALERICLKCLEKRPERRYASARQLAEDLADFLKGRPLRHARPESFWEWLVDLFSHSRHVEHFGDLGRVHLWMAPVELFVHLGVFFLLGLAWAEPAVWLLLFATYAVLFGLIYQIDSRRVRLLTPVEHLARLLWFGHLVGYAAVCLGYRLTTSDYATAVRLSYPTLGVLTGLAYLVLGGTYWSRYYLFACTWFVVAFFLALAPAWAPLVCGLYHGASGLAVGWWLWRAGREARPGEAR